ncbi:MAG: protein kinase [Capsulimonadales bacterium]|nr:protein kinase [Capsulimonadales bacterium]
MTQTGIPTAGPQPTGMPTLGNYTLVREIARSNDIVWEGVDPRMNRRVAVKELNLPPTLTGQARRDRIERFFREARAAGAMNHPNIVTIHEVGEDRGRYFIAMEYLEGRTLRERLSVGGALPIKEAVFIACGLADALAFAHSRGVVHRDIKPENVHLLTDGRVKLTDFGIARIQHETQLTVAGQVFGTPSYMSPEQVLGKEIDYRSDIFSLGVLLYEMVTGRRPFTTEGDSVVTITYRIMNDPTPQAIGVAPVLNGVIQRATAKSPADRYQTATEFGTALLAASQSPSHPADLPATGGTPAQPTVAYGTDTRIGTPPILQSPDDWARQAAPSIVPPDYRPAVNPVHPVAPTLAANIPPVPGASPTPPAVSRNSRTGALLAIVVAVIAVVSLGWFAGRKAYESFNLQNRSAEYKQLYKKGAELYKSARFQEAAAIFRRIRLSGVADAGVVRQAADGEVFSYRQLGQSAQERSDFAEAQRWFQEALKVSPGDRQAQLELEAVQRRLRGENAALSDDYRAAPPASFDNRETRTSTLASNAPMPGSVSTEAFVQNNAQGEMRAAPLLQQGIQAFQQGEIETAKRLWNEAKMEGPGSRSGIMAGEYYQAVLEGRNPLMGM